MPAVAPKPTGGYPSKLPHAFGLPTGLGTWQPVAATSGTDSACTNGTIYIGGIYINRPVTITGVQYLIGSVGGTDKVIAELFDEQGALLANSALAGLTVGTAANNQQVALTAAYNATEGLYFVGLVFNGTTAKFRSVPAHTQAGSGLLAGSVAHTFGTAAAVIPPLTFTADKSPVLSLY